MNGIMWRCYQAMAYLTRQTYRRAWQVGGGQLATGFHQRGLISEYRLFLIPLTLGAGIPLFPGQQAMQPFELTASQAYPTVVELRYRPADRGDLSGNNT